MPDLRAWAVEWHSRNRLDGDRRYLVWNHKPDEMFCYRLLRGSGIPAVHASKTTCPAGHPYDYIDSRGKRGCRTCMRASWTRHDRKRRHA